MTLTIHKDKENNTRDIYLGVNRLSVVTGLAYIMDEGAAFVGYPDSVEWVVYREVVL